MRVLITGGAGFLGSHLCEELRRTGHSVVALDDFSAGRRSDLSALEGADGFELVEGSAGRRSDVEPLARDADLIVHLAATVGVRRVMDETVRTLEADVKAQQVSLRAAASRRLPVVFASSSEVYGASTPPPFSEDAPIVLGSPDRPRWAYASSKAMGEFLVGAHAREAGTSAVVARLFNTVGPRQSGRYGMVLPRLCAQALAGEPLTVHGNGKQTRSFIDVRDAVVALARLCAVARDGDAGVVRVVNVGSGREVSIGELAQRVRALAGSASPIVRVPHETVYGRSFDDVPRRVPDLFRLAALTGFRARRSLDETIEATLEALAALAAPSA